jgi:hypothetical protein
MSNIMDLAIANGSYGAIVAASYGLAPGQQSSDPRINNNIANGLMNDGSIVPILVATGTYAVSTPTASNGTVNIPGDVTNPVAASFVDQTLASNVTAIGDYAEASAVAAATGVIAATNPQINTALNQNPASTAGLLTGYSGKLNSLITWIEANPILAAAAGLTIVGGLLYIGGKVVSGSTKTTAGTGHPFYETYTTKTGKTIKRRKYNREPKKRRSSHRSSRKLKFGSKAYRMKYLHHK